MQQPNAHPLAIHDCFMFFLGGCQLASAMSSLVSIALSLSSYHRALRRSVPDKYNMSRVGAILQFIWRYADTSTHKQETRYENYKSYGIKPRLHVLSTDFTDFYINSDTHAHISKQACKHDNHLIIKDYENSLVKNKSMLN